MPFSINEFKSAINAVGGLTKASKFFVRVFPPNNVAASIGVGSINDLSFLCEASSLPGVGLATEEIRMGGYGLVEKRAYAAIFQDVQLSFFNDSEGRVLKFFHAWIQSIYNFNLNTSTGVEYNNLTLDTLAYPSEYYGTVEISHYNDASDEIITYQLIDAYPLAIGDVQVDWALSDTLLKIPVTFAYKAWSADTLSIGAIDEAAATNANGLSNIGNGNNLDQILNQTLNLTEVTNPNQIQRIVDNLLI
jgi:hypothetical protein